MNVVHTVWHAVGVLLPWFCLAVVVGVAWFQVNEWRKKRRHDRNQ